MKRQLGGFTDLLDVEVVKNFLQLSVGYDLRWPWRVLNSSRPVGTSESRSADSIFQSHPVNDDSEVFPHQP